MPTTFITNKPINDLSTLSSGFGSRVSPTGGASSNHKGNDFAVRIGTPVYATHNAEVIYKGYDAKGWGNFIVLRDPVTGAGTLYAHLNSFSKITDPNTGLERDLAVGDQVSGGLQIALSGNTGAASTGAHFHFEVFGSDAISKMGPDQDGKYRNPIRDDIRENPRDHLASAFPSEFPTDVLSGPNAIEIIGDHRDNTLVGNSRPNKMIGKEGQDTYYVNFGDTITDPDHDGRIIIADDELKQSVRLEGNADPYINSESQEIIPDKWSLNGFFSKTQFPMKNLIFSLLLILIFSNQSLAEEAKSKTQNNTTQQVEEDPDLKLSIEELRKKYPIDWMEKKYGVVTEDDCGDGDDEPALAEAASWPCGTICSKYPEQKKCPKKCHTHKKNIPTNLVCSFFKEVHEGVYGQGKWVEKPVARFEDFSVEEVKSAFLYYFGLYENDPKHKRSCSVFEGNCYRSNQIVALTFIHFLTEDDKDLLERDRLLKSFVFSDKIVRFRRGVMGDSSRSFKWDECKFLSEQFLQPNLALSKTQNFCSQFSY